MEAFISWSGGKETSLACYKTMQVKELHVKYFLNMVSKSGRRSRSHGIGSALLKTQAEAIEISIVQRKTTWKSYEEEFKKAVLDLRKKGIEAGIFGNIDLQEHRDWVERVCKDIGIKPILPLWKKEREALLDEFIRTGFKAIVVAVQAKFLGREWLGCRINKEFIDELKAIGNVDPVRNKSSKATALDTKCQGISNGIDLCGEKGEYHTFVYDGPVFKKPVEFIIGKKILKNNHWFLELK